MNNKIQFTTAACARLQKEIQKLCFTPIQDPNNPGQVQYAHALRQLERQMADVISAREDFARELAVQESRIADARREMESGRFNTCGIMQYSCQVEIAAGRAHAAQAALIRMANATYIHLEALL